MWRFAKAATLAACCKRAGISVERYYTFLRRTADLGVKEILERYLEGEERRRWGRLAGPIGENFFVPSENMLAFRREATQEAARQNIRFFKELPGFENWFLDSVIPRTFSGRRFKFSELIPGAAQDGHTEEKTDQSQVQRASVTTGRRGRKKGWRDPGAIDRDKRMIDAWKGGQFDTPAELGRVFKVDKSYAYKLVRSLRASGK